MIPLAGPANKQARIVADVICGKDAAYKGSIGTSVMKFFDMTVAAAGEKEESLRAAGTAYRKSYTVSASTRATTRAAPRCSSSCCTAPRAGCWALRSWAAKGWTSASTRWPSPSGSA